MSVKSQTKATEGDEIIEILSCTVVPQISAHLTFSFGAVKPTENDDRKFGSILFACPIRVDIFDDEGSNLSFESEREFSRFSTEIPGIFVSDSSNYLKEYLKNESWVESHSGKNLSHYTIWSYGGGVVHLLSVNPPSIEEI